ncbi:MAG: helix-turn-helix domain-containing protein [Porcipelethomonas sp.]
MQNYLYLYPNLVAVRKATCTQSELAKKIGITQQEISRYERGEIKAPINYIADVATVCNVSVDYILGISDRTTNMMLSGEFEIVDLYRKLTKENKIKLKERAETLLDLQKK